MKRSYIVHCGDHPPRHIHLGGRDAWALDNLIAAGAAGCTPIDHPGPRWSAYVFKLKTKFGLNIQTITEPHTGAFPGTHARYVLHSRVTRAYAEQVAA